MTNNCSVLAADEHLLSISGFVVCGSAGAAQVSTDNVKSSGATGLLFEDRKKEIRADFLFASCAIQDIWMEPVTRFKRGGTCSGCVSKLLVLAFQSNVELF